MATRVAVFDVNETLLDLRALDPHFERIFGDAAIRRRWFGQLLQLSLTVTILDDYSDFAALGRAALEMVARERGQTISDEQKTEIATALRSLPLHPDVNDSLTRLRDAGFRMATLTNSPQAVVEAQLHYAGIYDLFEVVLSVDAVRRFKPAAATYRMAADRLRVETSGIRLIAAHGWDVWGAMRAGCAAGFIARLGQVLIPLAKAPDVVGNDLGEVVDAVLERDA